MYLVTFRHCCLCSDYNSSCLYPRSNVFRSEQVIWFHYLKSQFQISIPPAAACVKLEIRRVKRLSSLKIIICVGCPSTSYLSYSYHQPHHRLSVKFQLSTEIHQQPHKLIFTSSCWHKYEDKHSLHQLKIRKSESTRASQYLISLSGFCSQFQLCNMTGLRTYVLG